MSINNDNAPCLVDLKIIDQYIYIYIYTHTICKREGDVVVDLSKRKWIMPSSW
jgi:hypothetical protein